MNCHFCKSPTPNDPRICDACESLDLTFKPAYDGTFTGFAVMSRHTDGESLMVLPSMPAALDHCTGGIEGLSVEQAQQIIVEVTVRPARDFAWVSQRTPNHDPAP